MPIEVRKLFLRYYADLNPLIEITTPFTVPSGVSLLVAESGSGKTSLFRVLAGWFETTAQGPEFSLDSDFDPCRDVDFISNHQTLLPWFTVRRNAGLRAHDGELKSLDELWHAVGLKASVGELYPYELSLGMYKRAELVTALCSTSRLLLLDEFFTSLDPIARGKCLELISRLNRSERSIMITTHTPDILAGYPTFGMCRSQPDGPIDALERIS